MDAVSDRLGTGRFDSWQAIDQHGVEDVDHLPIAIVGSGELASDPLIAAGNTQSLKGAPLRKAPGLRASTGT